MNKLLLVAAAGLSIAALSSPASAGDGQINITGFVSPTTCVVSDAGVVAVALPRVSTTALPNVGSIAGTTAFQIKLTGCGAGPTATAYFDPGVNTDVSGRLKNGAAGTATGVQVRLLNAAGTAINLAAASGSQLGTSTTLVAGANNLNYFAEYYRSGATMGTGSIDTSVVFTMQYQ